MVRSETRIDSLIIAKWKNQCEARAGQGEGDRGLALVKLWNYVSPEFVSKDLNTEAPSWEQDKLFSTCFTTRVHTCRMSFSLLSLVLRSKSRVSLVNTDICFLCRKKYLCESGKNI